MRRTVPVVVAILMLGACILLNSLTPDQRFSKEIIGSWIVAGDSSNYGSVPMRERFYGEGTYRIFQFADATCTKVAGNTHLTLKIQDGILTSKITAVSSPAFGHVGDVLRFRVISL